MYDNILDTIGHTPLVKINRLNPKPHIPIYAKIEGFNPTGSIKDRIALKMIEQAEACGSLQKAKLAKLLLNLLPAILELVSP